MNPIIDNLNKEIIHDNEPLDLKYRPRKFDDVLGNTATINLIQNLIEKEEFPRFSIFSGPPGCGKTTTAFLVATALQCITYDGKGICGHCSSCQSLEETLYKTGRGNPALGVNTFDMGLNTEEEYLNNIATSIQSGSFMGKKIMIIEELQRTKRDAQESLLATLEFIPDNVHIIVTTSELNKIIQALRTRATDFRFNYPNSIELREYMKEVAVKEKIKIDTTTINLINQIHNNNPRQAMKSLDTVKASGLEAIEYIKDLKSFDYELYVDYFEKIRTSLTDTILFITELDDKVKFLINLRQFLKDSIVMRYSPTTVNIKKEVRDKITVALGQYSDELIVRVLDDLTKIGYVKEEDAEVKLLVIAQKFNRALYVMSTNQDELKPRAESFEEVSMEIEELEQSIKNTQKTLNITDL